MSDLRKAAEMALKALETLNNGDNYKTHNAATALRQALAQPDKVLAEREACAKVCEELQEHWLEHPAPKRPGYDLAAAIRARGEK